MTVVQVLVLLALAHRLPQRLLRDLFGVLNGITDVVMHLKP